MIAIVKEIQKKEERCEATLKLMEKAKTPWSAEMEKLIADEMKSNPGDSRLERQFQFANLRKMMKGYEANIISLCFMDIWVLLGPDIKEDTLFPLISWPI